MKNCLYNKSNPYYAAIKERILLTKKGSTKETYHIVLGLNGSEITYEVGDCIAVLPQNDPKLVELTLQAIDADGSEIIVDKHGSSHLLLEFLTKKANICAISRRAMGEIAKRLREGEQKEKLCWLLLDGNKDALKAYIERHHLWDCFEENRGANFTSQEFADLLMPLLPRFYSIASSQSTVGNEVHLTVVSLHYTSNEKERSGVCTNYLCKNVELNKNKVPIYVQPNRNFTLPTDGKTDIIMVGPGTGVAPFRAFMQERIVAGASGRNWLFFGECHRSYDYFYEEYWSSLQEKGVLRVDTAFSRDQEHKVYVQHRMREFAAEVYRWLKSGAVIYVCGDAKRMAKDVDAALHTIIEEEGRMSAADAKLYVKSLRKDQRYLRDVY